MRKKIICAIIIAAVLAVSFGVIAIRCFSAGGERIAYIYSEDTLIRTIDLNAVDKPYSFTVTNSSGGSNTIEVRQGEIGVTDATCPDAVCKKTGFISSPALPVVCLPNGLVIKIGSSKESGSIPDTIAH